MTRLFIHNYYIKYYNDRGLKKKWLMPIDIWNFQSFLSSVNKIECKDVCMGTCSNRVIVGKENGEEKVKKKKKRKKEVYTSKLEQSNKRCESKLDKLTSKYIVVSLLLLLHETSLIDWAIHVVK